MTARCAPESTIYDMPAAPDGITRYDLIAMAASDARLGRVLGNPPAETTQYDLRTLPERDADELAALAARVEALETMVLSFIAHVAGMSDEQARDAIGSAETTPAVVLSARCEERLATLEQAQARQADALTVMQLREGL